MIALTIEFVTNWIVPPKRSCGLTTIMHVANIFCSSVFSLWQWHLFVISFWMSESSFVVYSCLWLDNIILSVTTAEPRSACCLFTLRFVFVPLIICGLVHCCLLIFVLFLWSGKRSPSPWKLKHIGSYFRNRQMPCRIQHSLCHGKLIEVIFAKESAYCSRLETLQQKCWWFPCEHVYVIGSGSLIKSF